MPGSDDRKRFQEQAMPVLDVLYRVALRFAHHPEDAEDLVQDTLLKAYRAFDRFEEGTSLRAWMLRILTNTYYNRYRRRLHERRAAEAPPDDPLHEELYSDASMRDLRDPEAAMERPLRAEELQRALDRLPEAHRVVLVLAEVEGWSYREIADAMGTPIGTVMSRLYRARRMLQQDVLRSEQWDASADGAETGEAAQPAPGEGEESAVPEDGPERHRVVPLRRTGR